MNCKSRKKNEQGREKECGRWEREKECGRWESGTASEMESMKDREIWPILEKERVNCAKREREG